MKTSLSVLACFLLIIMCGCGQKGETLSASTPMPSNTANPTPVAVNPLTVSEPVANAVVREKSSVLIKWSGSVDGSSPVYIYLVSIKDGQEVFSAITRVNVSDGQYMWQVPEGFADTSKTYQIALAQISPFKVLGKSGNFTYASFAPTVHVMKSVLSPAPYAVQYGAQNVEMIDLDVWADNDEDVVLTEVVPEVYSRIIGEIIPASTVSNVRLTFSNTSTARQYGSNQSLVGTHYGASDGSWSYTTTYVKFADSVTIPKGSFKTFRILFDSTGDTSISKLVFVFPGWTRANDYMFGNGFNSHFKAKGAVSGKDAQIVGETFDSYVMFQNAPVF